MFITFPCAQCGMDARRRAAFTRHALAAWWLLEIEKIPRRFQYDNIVDLEQIKALTSAPPEGYSGRVWIAAEHRQFAVQLFVGARRNNTRFTGAMLGHRLAGYADPKHRERQAYAQRLLDAAQCHFGFRFDVATIDHPSNTP